MDLPNQVPCQRKSLTVRLLDSIKSKIEVSPDIFLYMYKNKMGDDFFIVYEIEVMRYCSGLHFVLDFTGSQNISLVPFNTESNPANKPRSSSSSSSSAGKDDEVVLLLKATVAPFQRQKFGQIHLLNPAHRAILKYKHSWSMCEVIHKTDMINTARELDKNIQQELNMAARLLPGPVSTPSHGLSTGLSPLGLHKLFNHNHRRGEGGEGSVSELSSFIDQTFPPTESSLLPNDEDVSAIQTNFPVVWNRPK